MLSIRSFFHWVVRASALLGLCGLMLLLGCSNRDPRLGKIVPVHGKVTLDNQPLTGGGVLFHAVVEKNTEGPISVPLGAKLEDDGSYSLRAPEGKYRVQLDRGDKSDKKQWARLPRKYSSLNSPLVVDVGEDKPEGGYDLKLSASDKQKVDAKRRPTRK
jgi:hypothetical protein